MTVRFKMSFSKKKFEELCERAVEGGFRHGGSQAFRQKPNGFANEVQVNSKGLPAYLKACERYYCDSKAERALEKARLLEQERELQEKKKKLGVI